MYSTLIKNAARELMEQLPRIDVAVMEVANLFHLKTNLYFTARDTLDLAFTLRREEDTAYRQIDHVLVSFSKLMADYRALMSVAASKGDSREKAAKQNVFTTLMTDPRYKNKLVFVSYAYVGDKDEDIIFHKFILRYNEWQEERVGRKTSRFRDVEGRREAKDEQRLVFVIYGQECLLPDILRASLRTIAYSSLKPEDFQGILQDAFNCFFADTRCTDSAVPIPQLRLDRKDIEWYANHMANIPEADVRHIIQGTWQDLYNYPYLPREKGDCVQRDRANFFHDRMIRERIDSQIRAYKNAVLNQNGHLRVIEAGGTLSGVEKLKGWLDDHVDAMKRIRNAPRGIVLAGPPGTGKSTAAKLASDIFGLPLVQLEMDRILGRYVGDSEKNMRAVLDDLAFAAPCVLWIDELEKCFSGAQGSRGGQGGADVTRRLFGMLLTFMQDNSTTVFLTATANDISDLPEEFFRNGRFDQVFCILLPDYENCAEIMRDKLDRYLAPKGETCYSLDDAREVLNCFIGTRDKPLFLSGADIEAYAKNISWYFDDNSSPDRDAIIKRIRELELPSQVRAQVPANSRDAMLTLARRYIDLISRNMTIVGGNEVFTQDKMDLDAARYYIFDEKKDELPLCFEKPDGLDERLASDVPGEWYDAVFFKKINQAMTECIIMDTTQTSDRTREEFWKYKTRSRRPAGTEQHAEGRS